MANLINHKCLIKKKEGRFSEEDLKGILSKIENNNYVYSDFYVSRDTYGVKLEYVAKYYPTFFEEEAFNSEFILTDIFSDAGGAADSINMKQETKNVLYTFDAIEIEGGMRLVQANNEVFEKDEPEIIHLSGAIIANTYNEEITEISKNKRKIVYLGKEATEKMIIDCLEIWSIQLEDDELSKKMIGLIKTLEKHPESRNFDNLISIKFKDMGKTYFEISWDKEKGVWEEKRKFDLWDIVKGI